MKQEFQIFFLTWGHTYNHLRKTNSKIVRGGIPFFKKNKNIYLIKKRTLLKKNILIILGVGNIFLSRNELFNYPIYEMNNLLNFISKLNQYLSNFILVKPHPLDKFKSFSFSKAINEAHPKIQIVNTHTNLNKLILNAKISIFASLGTEFFKNLYSNNPSVFVMQNFSKKTLNQTALKYFERLKKCNIIFYDSDSAAHFINNNYNNIEKWWFSSKTQNVIKFFIKEYANSNYKSFKTIIHTLKNAKNEILNKNEQG